LGSRSGISWSQGGVADRLGKQLRAGLPGMYPPWMQNGVVPKPTLLKAGLIATARSLGPVDSATQAVSCTGGDCRPSNSSGWGLVDMDRLTNTAVPVFVRNEQTPDREAGQDRLPVSEQRRWRGGSSRIGGMRRSIAAPRFPNPPSKAARA